MASKESAKRTIRSIFARLPAISDSKHAQSIFKWATTSESNNKINAMLAMAESEPSVVVLPQQMDVDSWLLNCAMGRSTSAAVSYESTTGVT